jgi:hypothetical protein
MTRQSGIECDNQACQTTGKRAIICLFMISLCVSLVPSHAQDYRTQLEIPPVKVFSAMLKFNAKGQYPQISKSIIVIEPLCNAICEHFDVDIKAELSSAVMSEDRTTVSKAITKMIFYDVMDILYSIDHGHGETCKDILVWVKMSYIEYQLIAGLIRKHDQSAYRTIEETFASLYRWGEGLDKNTNVLEEDIKAAKKHTKMISSKLHAIFEEF